MSLIPRLGLWRWLPASWIGKGECKFLPGARIEDIPTTTGSIMSGNGNNPIVCLGAEGNDVTKCRSEELLGMFRSVIGWLVGCFGL